MNAGCDQTNPTVEELAGVIKDHHIRALVRETVREWFRCRECGKETNRFPCDHCGREPGRVLARRVTDRTRLEFGG